MICKTFFDTKSKNMTNCYYCSSLITDENKSDEHIIQNSLGGRLKSSKLLCKPCNNDRTNVFDVEIAKQIYLPTILNIKRQRSDNINVTGHTTDGKKYSVDNNLKPRNANFFKPKELENGVMKFIARDINEARSIIKGWKKSNPSINIEQELSKINFIDEEVKGFIYFDSALVYGEKGVKAILKIALNYYFYLKYQKEYVSYPLDFLKGKIKGNYNNIVFHYYRDLNFIHTFNDSEISHLIHLKGDSKEKLLYCYVELFSVHCFLIILNYNYLGTDFSKTYCYDFEKKNKIDKSINFKVQRTDIDSFSPPIALCKDSLELFDKRLARVYDIKNIKYDFKKLEKGMYIAKNGYSEKNI